MTDRDADIAAGTQGVFLRPGEGLSVQNPVGGPLVLKVRGQDTAGALTALESTAAPGEGPPLHVHANEDELILVLDGTFRFRPTIRSKAVVQRRSSQAWRQFHSDCHGHCPRHRWS